VNIDSDYCKASRLHTNALVKSLRDTSLEAFERSSIRIFTRMDGKCCVDGKSCLDRIEEIMNKPIELLPCPLCGSSNLRVNGHTAGHGERESSVYCWGCGISGPGDLSKESARKAWNELKRVDR